MLAQLRIEKFTNHIRLIFAYTLPMSSERSSTTRMRLAGKICCSCKSSLPPPHNPGEKYCARCQSRIGCRRVYMYFMLREGWHCQFLEADLKTPLPKKLNLSSSQKIIETAERGGYNMNLEGRQALDHGIENGRGGIWLLLTEEQYQKLKVPR